MALILITFTFVLKLSRSPVKQSTPIQLKAAFLLIVFALNTVVGFACSVGVDLDFNSKHHQQNSTEALAHIHKDGKKHIHHGKKLSNVQETSHKHHKSEKFEKTKNEEGNCCTEKVKEFHQLDKSVPLSQNIIPPVVFAALTTVYFNILFFPHTNIVRDIKPFVRSYHPPIPDIRITIQSFQI